MTEKKELDKIDMFAARAMITARDNAGIEKFIGLKK